MELCLNFLCHMQSEQHDDGWPLPLKLCQKDVCLPRRGHFGILSLKRLEFIDNGISFKYSKLLMLKAIEINPS